MEQGGAEEITDRSERGGGRGEMRSEGGRDRGGEEIRKLYKYLKEIQKWGGFLPKSRRGEVFKGEGIITKRRERLERGEGKKEL